ncbi:Pentatricopeptide repeat-containing protein At3g06430, chloroplastic [Linum perenne]
MSLSFSSFLQTPLGRLSSNSHAPGNSSSSFHRRHSLHPTAAATPASPRRLWKQGEFPGTTQPSDRRRVPLKNVKKKLDRKEKAKAWVNTVTEAFSDSIANKQWLTALEVFEMLKQQPFYQPREGTYMKLLVLLGKSGQPELAHQLFDEMLQQGIPPTPQLYTALLAAYCRSGLIDKAFSILDVMKSLPQCQPDVFTYSTILKACVDSSRFDLVNSVYLDMENRLIPPNTVTQNILLSGYGRAGLYDEMEKVLSSMLISRTSKPDLWTMNIILSIFGNKGNIQSMEEWYKKFGDYGIEPDIRTFNILISSYGKVRSYDKMSLVMEYMSKLEIRWSSSTYNNVIEAFGDGGDVKNMEYTFNKMRNEGVNADSKTLSCLINGYAKAGMLNKVTSTVELAARLGFIKDTLFYDAVISAYAKADDLMEMEKAYEQMKEEKCEADSTTYSVLIEAYRNLGMNDKVSCLEQEMAVGQGSSG